MSKAKWSNGRRQSDTPSADDMRRDILKYLRAVSKMYQGEFYEPVRDVLGACVHDIRKGDIK